jgi:glycosyltransferase involved in cell wall biosynthesis
MIGKFLRDCKEVKKVLFIAYGFPPDGGSGTKRVVKFIKFLPQYGWEPIILTVRDGNYGILDTSLLGEIDNSLKVIRAYTFESLFKRIKGKKAEGAISSSKKVKNKGVKIKIRKLSETVYHSLGRYFAIPDPHILWIPHAVIIGARAILRDDIPVIFATGTPFSAHILGALLKVITRRKLLIDFRDAWTMNPSYKSPNPVRKKIEAFLEKKVIETSDLVISTTHGMTEDFRGRYKTENQNKFITITNGYDPEDFAHQQHEKYGKKEEGFCIVHTGLLRRERSPKLFLCALRQLIEETPELENFVEVIFVGQNLNFNDGKAIEDYIDELHLEKVVRIVGYVTRSESLQYQKSADLLLLIIGTVPQESLGVYGLSAKAFDYAMCGKPVLALAQNGATADFVRKSGIGIVVDPERMDLIKESILGWFKRLRMGDFELRPNYEEIEKYNLKKLTKELAACFEKCAIQ